MPPPCEVGLQGGEGGVVLGESGLASGKVTLSEASQGGRGFSPWTREKGFSASRMVCAKMGGWGEVRVSLLEQGVGWWRMKRGSEEGGWLAVKGQNAE